MSPSHNLCYCDMQPTYFNRNIPLMYYQVCCTLRSSLPVNLSLLFFLSPANSKYPCPCQNGYGYSKSTRQNNLQVHTEIFYKFTVKYSTSLHQNILQVHTEIFYKFTVKYSTSLHQNILQVHTEIFYKFTVKYSTRSHRNVPQVHREIFYNLTSKYFTSSH